MEFESGSTQMMIFPAIDTELTGRHVYRLLEDEGYTAKKVSGLLGFEEPQAVYNWKYGRRMPSIDNLDKISRLLNISINDLLVHTDDGEAVVFSFLFRVQSVYHCV